MSFRRGIKKNFLQGDMVGLKRKQIDPLSESKKRTKKIDNQNNKIKDIELITNFIKNYIRKSVLTVQVLILPDFLYPSYLYIYHF